MESIEKIKTIIEALLIVSEDGLNREDLQRAIESADLKDIEESLRLLKEEYAAPQRGFNLAEIAGRCRIVSKPEFMPWIGNLYQKDPGRLTGPSLETLAIIAYKQPVTRAEIENIRGVNLGGMLKTLLDKELIQIKGRKDVPGRPLVYGTTEKFLELFGLNSLEDLPALREFTEEDLEYGRSPKNPLLAIEEGDDDDAPLEEMDIEGLKGGLSAQVADEAEQKVDNPPGSDDAREEARENSCENVPQEADVEDVGLSGTPIDDSASDEEVGNKEAGQ